MPKYKLNEDGQILCDGRAMSAFEMATRLNNYELDSIVNKSIVDSAIRESHNKDDVIKNLKEENKKVRRLLYEHFCQSVNVVSICDHCGENLDVR